MELDELLELIDLEEPEQFEYFENFADIVESDEDISEDVLFQLFSKTDGQVVSDLIDNYFEDLFEAMPDDSNDVFMLLENIKKTLMGLVASRDDDNNMIHFAEELARFREWYCFESKVVCTGLKTGDEKILPVRDAVVISRLEKLDGEEHRYDFDSCLDYELDEYIMNLLDLTANEYDEEIEREYVEESEYEQ
jgi:hypothetical protein